MKKNVLVDMSATLLHHGHINLLKKAAKYGNVIVALTTDLEIKKKKGYIPEINFCNRKKILESIKYVNKVVASKWNIDDKFIKINDIQYLVHGSDEKNSCKNVKKIILKRTKNISSKMLRKKILKNEKK